MEHADVIPKKLKDTFNQELINEFYFYGEDFDKYKDELAGKDTTCTEMNIYLSDGLTVAVKIAKLY